MNILIVDSYETMRKTMIRYLELKHIFNEVNEENTIWGAKKILNSKKIDVLLLDIQLADGSGLELVRYSQLGKNKPIAILCSNYSNQRVINSNYHRNGYLYFDRSTEMKELKSLIVNLAFEEKEIFS